MKAFGLRFSIFLLFLLASLFSVMIIGTANQKLERHLFGRRQSFGHTYQRIPEFRSQTETNPASLIHLGSSTCYRGINPAAFERVGYSSFNLCSSSQTISTSRYLLDWSIALECMPKVVTLDVYPELWLRSKSASTESIKDLTINHSGPLDLVFTRMSISTGDPYILLTMLYFRLKDAFGMEHDWLGSQDIYKSKGFTYSIRPAVSHEPCNPVECHLSNKQKTAFNRIRKTCQESGIKLALINPPQLCEAVFQLPNIMEGLPCIEGNNWPLAKVDTLYYDDHHLRGVGAELYSEWLAGEVDQLINP